MIALSLFSLVMLPAIVSLPMPVAMGVAAGFFMG